MVAKNCVKFSVNVILSDIMCLKMLEIVYVKYGF